MMTISDIYDALTASDRPYKARRAEAEGVRHPAPTRRSAASWTRDLLRVFIAGRRAGERAAGALAGVRGGVARSSWSHCRSRSSQQKWRRAGTAIGWKRRG